MCIHIHSHIFYRQPPLPSKEEIHYSNNILKIWGGFKEWSKFLETARLLFFWFFFLSLSFSIAYFLSLGSAGLSEFVSMQWKSTIHYNTENKYLSWIVEALFLSFAKLWSLLVWPFTILKNLVSHSLFCWFLLHRYDPLHFFYIEYNFQLWSNVITRKTNLGIDTCSF